MPSPLESIIAAGTKIWLDSIDPDLVVKNRKLGATGATSNPIIVADLVKTGRFDEQITKLRSEGLKDADIAWGLTDWLVRNAQKTFAPVWEQTQGNDGYVSFELDPLLEDKTAPPHAERVSRYIELGRQWSKGHTNRMIKVPATPAGLAALEELAASGVTLNVTLIFSPRQYRESREAIWKGAQRRKDGLAGFKSVYSIFVSRVDVYTEKHVPTLSPAAQGMVGIVNAKQIWAENKKFWSDKKLKLQQEMIFASTGTKKPEDPADKYVAAFTGSDIETNPPATNEKVQAMGKTYVSQIANLPAQSVLQEIAAKVDMQKLEDVLMEEGLAKFADPQKALIKLISEKKISSVAK
ncbi:MAG: transaldolase [Phycisphaeraceae bacterium]|nr:transaldolase [Phycisphaeraceae bacterium]